MDATTTVILLLTIAAALVTVCLFVAAALFGFFYVEIGDRLWCWGTPTEDDVRRLGLDR